jgi:3-deoxy-7-phosphoheptulonate synthase
VLRGGRTQTNYDPESIAAAEDSLRRAGLMPILMVDCSHANSGKQPRKQEEVWASVVGQKASGTRAVIGAMVESYLEEGNQPIGNGRTGLRYGVSVTDACLGWTATERLLREGASQLREAGSTRVPQAAGIK